jgi:hypothetical protein
MRVDTMPLAAIVALGLAMGARPVATGRALFVRPGGRSTGARAACIPQPGQRGRPAAECVPNPV